MGLRSSSKDLQHFRNSNVWKDISDVFTDTIADAVGEIEVVDDMKTLYRLQGEIAAYRRMLSVVDVLIEEAKLNEGGQNATEGSN